MPLHYMKYIIYHPTPLFFYDLIIFSYTQILFKECFLKVNVLQLSVVFQWMSILGKKKYIENFRGGVQLEMMEIKDVLPSISFIL